MWAIKLPAQSSAPHHNQNTGILSDGTEKTQESSYLRELTWKHKSGNSSTLFFFRCDQDLEPSDFYKHFQYYISLLKDSLSYQTDENDGV